MISVVPIIDNVSEGEKKSYSFFVKKVFKCKIVIYIHFVIKCGKYTLIKHK